MSSLDISMGNEVLTSVMVPKDIIVDCRKMGWSNKEVFLWGYKHKKEAPMLLDKLKEYEEMNKSLVQKVEALAVNRDRLVDRIWDLEKVMKK
jgi:hypothetical protein